MDRGRNKFSRKRSRWENTESDNPNFPNTSKFLSPIKIKREIDIKEEDGVQRRTPRYPSHLKGKEIGLFFARQSSADKQSRIKKRRELLRNEPGKIIANVIIPKPRLNDIRLILKNLRKLTTSYFSRNISVIKKSEFKLQFQMFINGSFERRVRNPTIKQVEYTSEAANTSYYNFHMNLIENNATVKEMLIARQKLPCYAKRLEVLELVKNNQVVVICGETGCGKTTQIPQYILDDFIMSKNGSSCKILCTQPRRISAIAVAERVATERGEQCGDDSVGYNIRLEKKIPRESGCITYCTTGILLKIMETNPSLSGYSHIILDEIHERDVQSDFVITLLKMLIVERKDIKLILMSATLNAEQFSKYYDSCPILNIPGFTYPVQVYYLEDALAKTKFNFEPYAEIKGWRKHLKSHKLKRQAAEEVTDLVGPYVRNLQAKKKFTRQVCDNLMNPNSEQLNAKFVVELIKYICSTSSDDASILVFVPGFFDILRIITCLTDSKCFPAQKYLIISLHSKLPSIEQRKVFDKPPRGVRKIVIATNIAETSITIDDIIYVIDTGKIKMASYDVEENLEALQNEWVTVANADQRKGRAGRVQAGFCYHLFSRPRYYQLESYPLPEIQRTRLETVILTIKLLQLGSASQFLFKLMTPPHFKAIAHAFDLLQQMNALDKKEQLTPLGYHLAKLPVHPRMGKMILLGALFSCLDPILSIAASLDFKDAFQYPINKQEAVNERKMKLLSGWNSDHLVLAEAITQYEAAKACGKEKEFCWEYFLSRQTLELLCKMKEQFVDYLYEMKFITHRGLKSREWNQNSKNLSLIKAIVCAGLYPNVAIIRKVNGKGRKIISTTEGEKVVISSNSVNSLEKKFKSPLLVYHMKQKLLQINLFDTTMVHPLPILFFGDKLSVEPLKNEQGVTLEGKKNTVISSSKKLRFKCNKDTAGAIREAREKLDDLLLYKICNPGCVSWLDDTNPEVILLKTIMELITTEDIGGIDIETNEELYED